MKSVLAAVLLLVGYIGGKSQTVVEAQLDTNRIKIGEQATLILSVVSDKTAKIEFPKLSVGKEIISGIEVLEDSGVESKTLEENKTQTSQRYKITSFEADDYELPSQTIIISGKQFPTNSLKLSVKTVKVDTTDEKKYYPAYGVEDPSFTIEDWIDVIVAMIVMAVLALLMWLVVKRNRQNKSLIASIHRTKPLKAHEIAIIDLENLKQSLHGNCMQKEFSTSLTDILRNYLNNRFGILAMEMTSNEVFSSMRECGEIHADITHVRQVLTNSDLAKFANKDFEFDINIADLETIRRFVDETKEKADDESTDKELIKASYKTTANKWNGVVLALLSTAFAALMAYVVWRVIRLL